MLENDEGGGGEGWGEEMNVSLFFPKGLKLILPEEMIMSED